MKVSPVQGLFVSLCCALGCLDGFAQAQQGEPPLLPLTEAERKIDLRTLVEDQPDFHAVENYFSARDISGFSAAFKVARKGKQYRTDTGMVIVITELNKPRIRLTDDKTYEEGVGNHRPFISATVSLNPTDLLGYEDISFEGLGAIELDGSRLLKIQAKSKGFQPEVYLYADPRQRNLITIVQIIAPQRRSIQRLQQVSFDVPPAFFDLAGRKPLPKFEWKKVASAKVTYRGKEVPNGMVFRHGDYLFVHAGEFDHFFLDLKNGIADTVVFQGLLAAKDGRYIWTTNETEALSIGDLTKIIDPKCDSCVTFKGEGNSVSLPDPDRKVQVLLRVDW